MTVMEPTRLEKMEPHYYEGHRGADVVTVVVYRDAEDAVKVVPEVVSVENAAQKVIWFAIGGEIDTIEFHDNRDTPGPPAINLRSRRIEARFPPGLHKGPHEYQFTFHTDGGKAIPVDPIAVIEY